MEEQLKDLKNWTSIKRIDGLETDFRFVLLGKCAYQIYTEYWELGTPIEDAIASLCLFGFWEHRDKKSTIEREWLGVHMPIKDLLDVAYEDYKENMK